MLPFEENLKLLKEFWEYKYFRDFCNDLWQRDFKGAYENFKMFEKEFNNEIYIAYNEPVKMINIDLIEDVLTNPFFTDTVLYQLQYEDFPAILSSLERKILPKPIKKM